MNLSDSVLIRDRQPLRIEKVRELESQLGVPLPDAYVEFLSQCGGCWLAGNAMVMLPGGGILPIDVFFDEKRLFANLVVYEDLSADFSLAIARDGFGNPYVLHALFGSIFYLDFAVNPPEATQVADSFDKFLASIEPYSDSPSRTGQRPTV
jgi:SMI1 / KNR4 family (SUKH-1)